MFQAWRSLIRNNVSDGFIWQCNSPLCNRSRKSIREGSYFAQKIMRMPVTNGFSLLFAFATYMRQTMAEDLLDRICSKITVSNYFNDFRVLLTNDMLANPMVLGGPGIEVISQSSMKCTYKCNIFILNSFRIY